MPSGQLIFENEEVTLNQRHYMVYRLLLASLFLFLHTHIKSQSFDVRNFVQYTTVNGLSHNTITSITQDPYGYIWIGTNKGLNRFDGTSFQQFFRIAAGIASQWTMF